MILQLSRRCVCLGLCYSIRRSWKWAESFL